MRELVLFIHILLGVMWAGGILFIGWGVFPAAAKMPVERQRTFLIGLMKHTHYLFTMAGTGVVLTGIILGTVFGPLHSWDTIRSTTYGHLWLTALSIGTFALFWGVFVGYREMMLVFTDDYLWKEAAAGSRKALSRDLFRLAALESVEVLSLVALIFLMVKW
ncbi:hypothetical protein [Thalassobacillus devorans]|uniref:hypothetical protein n=1 Tax=Thalassobacillus devorans TaxID=279813 RepID=UPI00048F2EC6|nr:hypothetical protein [Thalassobacillus devorans]